MIDAAYLLDKVAPTAGALLIAAVLLLLLRIPQSSRLIAQSYERVIKQLREDNAEVRSENERLQTEVEQLEGRIETVRAEARAALKASEEHCDQRIATLENLVTKLLRQSKRLSEDG